MKHGWKKGLMKFALVVAAAASAAGAMTTAAQAGGLPTVKGYCGMVVTQSMKLKNDLTCAGDALRINADQITVDLDGHTLTGTGVGAGVRNHAAFVDNFTVRNGTVKGFDYGVHLHILDGVTITNLTFAKSKIANLYMDGVSNTEVVGNTIKKGNVGLKIEDSNGNTIRANKIADNSADGIWLKDNSLANLVLKNVIEGNHDGIDVQEVSNSTKIDGNTIRYNAQDGISVEGSKDVLIQDNVTSWNEDDGIETTGGTTINGNTANKNGFVNGVSNLVGRGIAAPYFTAGGGNSASGNDDTDCTPAYLCS
jgi:parallel beta-helix repeat protein